MDPSYCTLLPATFLTMLSFPRGFLLLLLMTLSLWVVLLPADCPAFLTSRCRIPRAQSQFLLFPRVTLIPTISSSAITLNFISMLRSPQSSISNIRTHHLMMDISIWMSHRPLKLNMPKAELLIFSPSTCTSSHFPLSVCTGKCLSGCLTKAPKSSLNLLFHLSPKCNPSVNPVDSTSQIY